MQSHQTLSKIDAEAGPAFLDCTLRDGGYYTNWDYPQGTLSVYFRAIAALPVKIVEVGYISKSTSAYRGKFHYLSSSVIGEIRERIAPDQTLCAMIDAKNHSRSDVRRLLRDCLPVLEMVRFAVAPESLEHGANLAEEARELGYHTGLNIMYLSKWWENPGQVPGLDRALNVAGTVALVDSYGACEPAQVAKAVGEVRAASAEVTIGFHGHDNLGLAFANSLAAIEAGAGVIDGTISGMGRGAGNTSTQTLLVREAARSGANLDLDALASVEREFEVLKREFQWGASLPYVVSGASGLPQRDVMDWIGKNRYAMESILRALRGDTLEGVDHRTFRALQPLSGVDELVVLGGGPSVAAHHDALADYVELSGATVLHTSHRNFGLVGSLGQSQIVCLTGEGIVPFPLEDIDEHVLAYAIPEKPRLAGTVPAGAESKARQVAPFALDEVQPRLGPVPDIAPLALALGVVTTLGVSKVSLAGFDGYSLASPAQQALTAETSEMLSEFRRHRPDINIVSLTPNSYGVPEDSIYARISVLNMIQEDLAP